MAVRVVRLGSKRSDGEGIRIGTVRLPPRGVPKAEFSSQNWYDVWFPNLAPSMETMKLAQKAATDRAVDCIRQKVPGRNGDTGEPSLACSARCAFTPHQLLGGLLLRRRSALPSIDITDAPCGKWRQNRVTAKSTVVRV